ncbi:MAG: hypothetical protein O3B01_27430 [Planctomycetota bacterium]|nr:hypothetical protein [Planctomycetota bacterium]MDA1142313.1 hypothetical protein [Planctomycetota bacterium]
MRILKRLWDFKRKVGKLVSGIFSGPKKSAEERKADGLAAIKGQETEDAVQVRCIEGKSAFTIQLICQAGHEIHGVPEFTASVEGLQILAQNPKQVTMGYLFTERTKEVEHATVEILFASQDSSGERSEGKVRIEFRVAKGGKPELLNIGAA